MERQKKITIVKNKLDFVIMCMVIITIILFLANHSALLTSFSRTPRVLLHEKVMCINNKMTREEVLTIMGKPDEAHAVNDEFYMVYDNDKRYIVKAKTFEERLVRCIIVTTNDVVRDVMRIYQ